MKISSNMAIHCRERNMIDELTKYFKTNIKPHLLKEIWDKYKEITCFITYRDGNKISILYGCLMNDVMERNPDIPIIEFDDIN